MGSYRQLKPRQTLGVEPQESQLTPEQMAAYIRQSTTNQVENATESTGLQLTGAQRYAISQGLDADKIVVAHEGDGKRGVSGTLRIDQRERLQEIMADINADKIKLVWAYSVSRLFRDKYGVQVGTFVEACANHGVKVVIENAKTFDFSNSFDVMMFQFLANVAARENDDRAKLMNAARHRKSLRGEFDGRTLIAGFIVDRNKASKTYGKYIPYAPHREVVERLFKRFRELGGQFNVLASEVAKMPYVFPDFEPWVDQRDINRFCFKKVPGGYHISTVSLLHLLTAVEYIGYWKVDGQVLVDADGKPVKNHDAVVPMDDWQYAFTCLSFTTLEGLPNPDRTHGATWTPVTRTESRHVLSGILTSPRGTIQTQGNTYRVAEKVAGKPQRSGVLSVEAALIDNIFLGRFRERVLLEMDGKKFFYEQLAKLKEQHTKALVSVDEQLARYYKERAGIQAYIKAVGATADKATLQQYNEDLLNLTANINELENKKNTAAAKEASLMRIQKLLNRAKDIWELFTDRSFIQLVAEKIILDEYSSHFLTLTIVWRAPFYQVDVAYIYRARGSHQSWSAEDEADLARLYPDADRLELLERFPDRTWKGIYCWALSMGIERHKDQDSAGISGYALSLKDWQLLQQHEWELPTHFLNESKIQGAYWLYDVANDVVERCSRSPTSRLN